MENGKTIVKSRVAGSTLKKRGWGQGKGEGKERREEHTNNDDLSCGERHFFCTACGGGSGIEIPLDINIREKYVRVKEVKDCTATNKCKLLPST